VGLDAPRNGVWGIISGVNLRPSTAFEVQQLSFVKIHNHIVPRLYYIAGSCQGCKRGYFPSMNLVEVAASIYRQNRLLWILQVTVSFMLTFVSLNSGSAMVS
jgi:hypothetical protein